MGDSTKVDLENIRLVAIDVGKVATKLGYVKDEIAREEIPIDPNLETIDTSGLQSLLLNLKESASKLKEEILTIYDNFKKAEAENKNLKIGDLQFLDEGINYYEIGTGEGASGTIGNSLRGKGEYVIDRVAFYINGKLVANINDTGTNVEEARMKYAKEYDVDLSEVGVSLHVSTKEGNATGWLDREQMPYDKVNKVVDYNELEKATSKQISEYESKNIKIASADECKTKYIEIQGEVPEEEIKPSFWATAAHGFSNIGIGMLDVVPLIPQKAIDTLQKNADEFYYEQGSYLTDGEKKMQNITGGLSLTALTIAATMGAGAGAAAGETAETTALATTEGATVVEAEVVGETAAETTALATVNTGTEIQEAGRIIGTVTDELGNSGIVREVIINGEKMAKITSGGKVQGFINEAGEVFDAAGNLIGSGYTYPG